MTNKIDITDNSSGLYQRRYRWGINSPRSDGKLVLRDNEFAYQNISGKLAHTYGSVSGDPRYFVTGPHESYMDLWRGVEKYPDVASDTELRQRLRTKIATNDFNVLITAMEGKETIKGITDRASRLALAFTKLRRGDLGGFGRALDITIPPNKRKRSDHVRKNISGHLLEYQFGLVPLYQDMYNSCTLLYDMANQVKKTRVNVQSRGDLESSYNIGNSIRVGDFNLYSKADTFIRYRMKTRKKLTTTVTVTDPTIRAIGAFGFTNPAAAVYAVLPSSWIVDAFLPVGDFLDQLYMPPGLSVSDCLMLHASSGWAVSDPLYAEPVETGRQVWDPEAGTWKVVWATAQGARGRGASERVDISNTIEPFPPVVPFFDMSLPFLGQAISILAVADQRSKDLVNLANKFRRR